MRVRGAPVPTGRIRRPYRWAVSVTLCGLWSTGAIWLLSHDVFVTEGPYGPVHRPLDAWLLSVHGTLAVAGVWLLGLLWGVHVPVGWAQGRRRRSGAALLGAGGLLSVTGVLLYDVGDEAARLWIAAGHWSLGLGVPGLYVIHRVSRRRSIRRRSP